MPFAHYTLTLTGSPQILDTVIPAATREMLDGGARALTLQPDGANTNPIYVGGSNATVTSSNFAYRLEAGVSTVPPAPFFMEFETGPLRLGHLTVLGTAGEKLHIGQIVY